MTGTTRSESLNNYCKKVCQLLLSKPLGFIEPCRIFFFLTQKFFSSLDFSSYLCSCSCFLLVPTITPSPPFFWPCCPPSKILVPQPGMEPSPLQWKCGVLIIELPGNSLSSLLNTLPQFLLHLFFYFLFYTLIWMIISTLMLSPVC